eukprot:220009-Prorocentrum_minimum.AAC.1
MPGALDFLCLAPPAQGARFVGAIETLIEMQRYLKVVSQKPTIDGFPPPGADLAVVIYTGRTSRNTNTKWYCMLHVILST